VNFIKKLATYATALRIVFAWYVFVHISKYLTVRDKGSAPIAPDQGVPLPKVLCLSVSRAFLPRKALGMASRQRLKTFSLMHFELKLLNRTAGNDYNSDVRESSTTPQKKNDPLLSWTTRAQKHKRPGSSDFVR
jgi:hypothetical protein